ncbi:MAG: hypothetical protein KME26_24620 [Oscillatoria princeps RMCB-10]|nr:hypothetical protein [Oscillatoria princeps RMCB-10]
MSHFESSAALARTCGTYRHPAAVLLLVLVETVSGWGAGITIYGKLTNLRGITFFYRAGKQFASQNSDCSYVNKKKSECLLTSELSL